MRYRFGFGGALTLSILEVAGRGEPGPQTWSTAVQARPTKQKGRPLCRRLPLLSLALARSARAVGVDASGRPPHPACAAWTQAGRFDGDATRSGLARDARSEDAVVVWSAHAIANARRAAQAPVGENWLPGRAGNRQASSPRLLLRKSLSGSGWFLKGSCKFEFGRGDLRGPRLLGTRDLAPRCTCPAAPWALLAQAAAGTAPRHRQGLTSTDAQLSHRFSARPRPPPPPVAATVSRPPASDSSRH